MQIHFKGNKESTLQNGCILFQVNISINLRDAKALKRRDIQSRANSEKARPIFLRNSGGKREWINGWPPSD